MEDDLATPGRSGLRDDTDCGEYDPPFLKLPAELRNVIYRYATANNTPIQLYLSDVDPQSNPEARTSDRRPLIINLKPHPHPLALTCRKFYAEVRPIYLLENTFCLSNLTTTENLHVEYIEQFRKMICQFAKRFKKVNIDYRFCAENGSGGKIEQRWARLTLSLHHVQLRPIGGNPTLQKKMGREEQKEEREVLDSIFPDEIQDISDTEYRVTTTVEVSKEPEDETPDPILILTVRYPEAYPDVAPELDITQPHNAPKHPHLNLQEDKARLLEALQPTIEESLGMAMVFTLVSTLKDSAELLISERQQAIQAEKDMEAAKAEEEENKKFEGQKVTRETFLAWREGFQKEMAERAKRRKEEQEAEDKKKRGYKPEEKKMTGKQLWESGVVTRNAFEDDEEEEGDDVMEGMRNVKVSG
ncbi:hypothetical protein KC349_g1704 [Hortaea werneckii]|nr:hypothetical protein KC349_g1704 [Hortaea werneckii]